ncbi:hypothetical protein CYY_001187 [Polysphondylium violaceum]|uniref:Enoyl reductase (ER) domain-containing protein n=1 Tax=Polysphondylium violaceum TaxID=133409 RepID=A0A8J4V4G8_9MYCE|nr:hypothetical protein CYY_001187 [Polysphondylium violaceum]
MKSVILKEFGGIGNLLIGKAPKPVPRSNELLVKVKSFGLNRADILQRMGRYPPPPGESDLLGLEMSGIVVEDATGTFKKGDKVLGLVGGGGYGEYCTIAASHAIPMPHHLTFEEAAAVPEAWLTAYQALFPLANYQKGDSVLIHAAASGVGTALIQLCKVSGAQTIIGTCGSDDKGDFIKSLGCTHTINYKTTESFYDSVKQITGGKGVNNVFDYVGPKYWNQNLKSLSMDGTMIIQGLLSGASVKENADIGAILSKRLNIKGSTLRNRSEEYKTDLIQKFEKQFLNLFETGALKPVVDKVFEVNDIQAAHEYLEGNHNKGKVIVRSFDFDKDL